MGIPMVYRRDTRYDMEMAVVKVDKETLGKIREKLGKTTVAQFLRNSVSTAADPLEALRASILKRFDTLENSQTESFERIESNLMQTVDILQVVTRVLSSVPGVSEKYEEELSRYWKQRTQGFDDLTSEDVLNLTSEDVPETNDEA